MLMQDSLQSFLICHNTGCVPGTQKIGLEKGEGLGFTLHEQLKSITSIMLCFFFPIGLYIGVVNRAITFRHIASLISNNTPHLIAIEYKYDDFAILC